MVLQTSTALKSFELENAVQNLDSIADKDLVDSIYQFDQDQQDNFRKLAPWKREYVLRNSDPYFD